MVRLLVLLGVCLLQLQVLLASPAISSGSSSNSNSATSGSLRAWKCEEGRCVRTGSQGLQDRLQGPLPLQQSSQAVCRLHCGQYGALWPRPTGTTTIGHQVVSIDPARIRVQFGGPGSSAPPAPPAPPAPLGVTVHAVLQESARALDAALKRMCEPGCVPGDHGLAVTVNVTSAEHDLGWDSDESYRLQVDTKGGWVLAQVLATTVWGARHGVHTLAQMLTSAALPAPSGGGAARASRAAPTARRAAPAPRAAPAARAPAAKVLMLVALSSARVSDAPRYPHRGLLLDTARHYLPLSALLRTVDAMAATKLNVLHWHATDSHSFPLLLPSAPQLARLGAYSSRETYSPAAVTTLLRYARLRGVRVLLEVDAPAHCSAGWSGAGGAGGAGGAALVLCANKQPWRSYCIQPPCGQLNPTNPAVYDILRAVYSDLTRALPAGEALHLGGDEVFLPCWNASREVTDYLQATGRGRSEADLLSLWAEFHAGALAALDQATGRADTTAILWSSHLTRPPYVDSYVDRSRYVIETWTEAADPLPEQLLARGYRVILAAKDAWYLDHGWWGRTAYRSWRTVRDRRLPSAAGTPGAVLGGEAALWGELADADTLDSKLWPRAAALAERLWSDPAEPSTARGVEARFLAHRDRLLALGVRAEAVTPQWCQLHDGQCD